MVVVAARIDASSVTIAVWHTDQTPAGPNASRAAGLTDGLFLRCGCGKFRCASRMGQGHRAAVLVGRIARSHQWCRPVAAAPVLSGLDPRSVEWNMADDQRRARLYEVVLREGSLDDVRTLVDGSFPRPDVG